MQSIKIIINLRLFIIMQNVLDIKALGLLLVTLVMLYLKYFVQVQFVKYDLTAVFYHAITYSLFNYLQTKTSAKCINK